ncbi:MAG: hypothetical protein OIF55_16215, partial [Amphritea sp.]|nr:hypothetical protein [Amphritea sp.]
MAIQAQTLPDAATPGAVIDERPDLLVQPDNELNLTIPAKKDRPLDLDSGPVIRVETITLYQLDNASDDKLSVVNDAGARQIIREGLAGHSDGFTLGQLQSLTDEVTNYYRQQGWILTTVYLPAQEVESGEVVFHLLPGTLSTVSVVGDSSY